MHFEFSTLFKYLQEDSHAAQKKKKRLDRYVRFVMFSTQSAKHHELFITTLRYNCLTHYLIITAS